jgi:hypothetical protein
MFVLLRVALLALCLLENEAAAASGNKWNTGPTPAETSSYQASLVPTIDGTPVTPSVRSIGTGTDRPRTQGILASTTWLKGAFAAETEVSANHAASPGDDPSGRMMRLGLTGSKGVIRYGMTYRTADPGFSQAPGQEQREAWGEWNNGAIEVRSTVGQRSQLDADAQGNRLQQSYNKIDVSWGRPAWPRLALKYAQNAASNTMDPLSLFPQRADHHRVEAAVGYGGAFWDAKLASSYGLETDLMNRAAESRVRTQTLTGSLRPLETLTITPTLGYRAERPEWSNARIDSPSASLTMSYKQSPRMSMTAMGNYFAQRSTDKLIDLDNIGGKGVITWELEPLREWKPQLSLEGGYNLQINRLMPSGQTENLSGLLRLVLATM